MRYIVIEKAQAGMLLAKSIYDGAGRVLLGAHTVITQEYISKLGARGLPGIYVEDELAKDIEIEETITQELRNQGVEALKKGNIDACMNVAKEIVDQILEKSVVSLDMVDLRTYDDYTYQHSVNVAVISTIIGMNMSFKYTMLQELSIAAILHDIGKSMIEPAILNKADKLSEEEYALVKKHPDFGYEMLRHRLDISACIRAGVLSHHENVDGTGYPQGLNGSQIYVYAKIIHVADVFDALTAKRVYKMPYARSEAVEYLMGSCDRLFDREVVEAFLMSVPIYPKGTMVKLSNGKEALVVANTGNALRPQVRLSDGEEMNLSTPEKYRNITIIPEPDTPVS